PPVVAHVCDDVACRASGALELCAGLERHLGAAGHAAPGARATWRTSPCLGLCDSAPAAFVQLAGQRDADRIAAPTTVSAILDLLAAGDAPAHPDGRATAPERSAARGSGSVHAPQTQAPERASLRLLRRVGHVDPDSLDDYRAHDGYGALRRALEL